MKIRSFSSRCRSGESTLATRQFVKIAKDFALSNRVKHICHKASVIGPRTGDDETVLTVAVA